MPKKTLGQLLIEAIEEDLDSKKTDKVARTRITKGRFLAKNAAGFVETGLDLLNKLDKHFKNNKSK